MSEPEWMHNGIKLLDHFLLDFTHEELYSYCVT